MRTFKEFVFENDNESEDNTIHYPEGVYIACKLSEESEKAVREYQEKYLKQFEINEELHCTLIYSKKPQVDEIIPSSYQATCTFNQFELFGPKSDTLVIELISNEMIRRNEELVKEHKFVSDYSEYKPHITLSYGVENIDLNSLPSIDFMITLQDEYVEELNTDWDSNSEESGEESGTIVGQALKKIKDAEEAEKSEKSEEKDE
jgi:2'-5' RNA ligase